MPNSNVRIESTMLNNGVHAVPTAHWENWKADQSILNMEAIDNKVYFFLMISLISIPFYYFTKINIKKMSCCVWVRFENWKFIHLVGDSLFELTRKSFGKK